MNKYMQYASLAPVLVAAFCQPGFRRKTQPSRFSVDGKPVPLALTTAPAAAKVTSSNGYVNIKTTNMSLHVWAGAPKARDHR